MVSIINLMKPIGTRYTAGQDSLLEENLEVVALDLDGVLFDGASATLPIAERVGIGHKLKEVLKKSAVGNLSLEESIIEGAKVWKDVSTDTLQHLVHDLPLMEGAEETVTKLKREGYQVGCVSSGVSQWFMAPFSDRLDLDFAYSNVLSEHNGKHDGRIEYIMGAEQKAERILEYLVSNGFNQDDLVSVGNGENDIDMFSISALSIAFNPVSEKVAKSADYRIESRDLRDILPYILPSD
ncbi:MAG: HAD-IB family phosphatase [Promethearchaeia archaeon]